MHEIPENVIRRDVTFLDAVHRIRRYNETMVDPSFGFHFLVYVLIVVSVGGLGSITGSFVGAALLGIGDVAGKYFVPEIGSFLIYLMLVAILLVRPLGLFGRR